MGRASRRQDRVLEHLTALSELPLGGDPEPGFKERLRAELLSGALALELESGERDERARPHSHRRPARRRPLLSQLAAVGLALAMMVSSFATYRAVPGDSLYPLKRAAESTLVRLSSGDAERGERELDSASTRAKEVASLLGSSIEGPLINKTLKDMEESTRAGIKRLKRAEPRSPKIKKFARDQENLIEPMLEQLGKAEQAQAEGYLDYIEGLAAPE